jgi:hypothetical protein
MREEPENLRTSLEKEWYIQSNSDEGISDKGITRIRE